MQVQTYHNDIENPQNVYWKNSSVNSLATKVLFHKWTSIRQNMNLH